MGNNFIVFLDNQVKGAMLQTLKYYRDGIFDKDTMLLYRLRARSAISYRRMLRNESFPVKSFLTYHSVPDISGKIILYPFNAVNNCHMVAKREAKHIFVTHGESHKITSVKPILRIYDHVIVAGQGGIDRLLQNGTFSNYDVESGKLIRMGDTFIGDAKYKYSCESSTLLYAPTWEGGFSDENYSSLTSGIEAFKLMYEYMKNKGFDSIVIQPHPNTGFRDPRYIKYLYAGIKYLKEKKVELKVRDWTNSYSKKLFLNSDEIVSPEEILDISVAFADISAMEVQLLNKDIPTFIFFNGARNSMPNVELLKKYYGNVGVYNFKSAFKVEPEIQKLVKNYYLSYEDGLETYPLERRLDWLERNLLSGAKKTENSLER